MYAPLIYMHNTYIDVYLPACLCVCTCLQEQTPDAKPQGL